MDRELRTRAVPGLPWISGVGLGILTLAVLGACASSPRPDPPARILLHDDSEPAATSDGPVAPVLRPPTARSADDAAPGDGPAALQTFWIFLEAGPNQDPLPPEEAAAQQEAHVGNLARLGRLGVGRAAGPIDGASFVRGPRASFARGIVLVEVPDEAALAECFAPDPFVRDGRLVVRAYPFERLHGEYAPLPAEPKLGEHLLAWLSPGAALAGDRVAARAALAELVELCAAEEQAAGQELLLLGGSFGGDAPTTGVLVFPGPGEGRAADPRELLPLLPPVADGRLLVAWHPLYLAEGLFR